MRDPQSQPATLPRFSTRVGGAWLVALGLLGAGFLACHPRQPKTPDWVATAPASTVMAVSGTAGWILEQPNFQTFLERFPMAEQTLDLFLKRAHINPHQETGRISFFLLNLPVKDGAGAKPDPADFLLQLGGFKDPAALQMALADAFPTEGSLPINGREWPLFVLLDINQYHIRAVSDHEGRIWLGELGALTRLGSGRMPARNPVARSAEWINGGAPFQGYLRPQGLLEGVAAHLPGDLARNLPQGIEALAWSVTPGQGQELHRFELAISGSREGILQVAPWLQRFVAAATALPGAAGRPPEILQENGRIGLRAQLTPEQVNTALAKLNQPGIRFGPQSKAGRK
jgi:hypothetical protein